MTNPNHHADRDASQPPSQSGHAPSVRGQGTHPDQGGAPSPAWGDPPAWLMPRVADLVRQGYDEAGVLAMITPELAHERLGGLASPALVRHVAEQFLTQPPLAALMARLINEARR